MFSTPLPRIIEPLKLVEQRVDLQGVIELSQLKQLQGVMIDVAGEVQVSLQFAKDEEGIRTITGTVITDILMECQRCLRPVRVHIEGNVNLGIVLGEESARNLPSYYDPLLLDGQHLELISIVEEELILSLPLIASHPANECSIDSEYRSRQAENAPARPNPFDVLAELKKPD